MGFVESSKEASRGGFQNIKTIRGMVVKMDVVDPPPTWQTTKKQFKVWLEDAAILERFDPDDEFNLKEGKFEFQYPYAEVNKKPSAVGPYMRCMVMPLEKVGKKPSMLVGHITSFSKIPTPAGFSNKNEAGEKVDVVYDQYFVPVEGDTLNSPDTLAYIKAGVKDKHLKQALRFLVVDDRAKLMPEFKDMLNAGTLGAKVGLELVNDVFTEPKSA